MKQLISLLLLALLLTACAQEQPPASTTAPIPPQPVQTMPEPQPIPAQPTAPAASQPAGQPQAQSAEAPSDLSPAQQAFYDSLNRDSEALLAFDAFLNGNIKAFDVDTAQSQGLNSLQQAWSGHIARLTLADLDGDGAPELLLWMATDTDPHAGYAILRYDAGSLVSYGATYRTFDQLKLDGAWRINAQDGSGSFGYGDVVFDGQTCTAYTRYTDPAAHDAKEDAYWFDSWQHFYYPDARTMGEVIQGIP